MKIKQSWKTAQCFRFLLIFTSILLSQPSSLPAQASAAEPDPWEPDALAVNPAKARSVDAEIPVDADLAVRLIRFYQTDININSISRCPFAISCSNFAMQAIRKYGFGIGILIFIDRICFRENQAAYLYYPIKRNERNQSRLDDTYFLTGELSNE
jgi:putative component of membrane protein insertase Oxa1/YidC/SpoIIIJ protein YidD